MHGKKTATRPWPLMALSTSAMNWALQHGATAGKITGAGGGGFLVYRHEQAQENASIRTGEHGLEAHEFPFDQ